MCPRNNSVVILSENADATTSEVMAWIMSMQGSVIRINRDDENLRILVIDSEQVKIKTSFVWGVKQNV